MGTQRDTAEQPRRTYGGLAAVVRQALATVDGSPAELARQAGWPESRMGAVRSGVDDVRPEEVETLADALAARNDAALAERVLRMALEIYGDGGA